MPLRGTVFGAHQHKKPREKTSERQIVFIKIAVHRVPDSQALSSVAETAHARTSGVHTFSPQPIPTIPNLQLVRSLQGFAPGLAVRGKDVLIQWHIPESLSSPKLHLKIKFTGCSTKPRTASICMAACGTGPERCQACRVKQRGSSNPCIGSLPFLLPARSLGCAGSEDCPLMAGAGGHRVEAAAQISEHMYLDSKQHDMFPHATRCPAAEIRFWILARRQSKHCCTAL